MENSGLGENKNQVGVQHAGPLSDYKIFYGVLLLLGIVAVIVVIASLYSGYKSAPKGLTDDERTAIEKAFGSKISNISDVERQKIEKSVTQNTSASKLSDEERRSIEQAFSH